MGAGGNVQMVEEVTGVSGKTGRQGGRQGEVGESGRFTGEVGEAGMPRNRARVRRSWIGNYASTHSKATAHSKCWDCLSVCTAGKSPGTAWSCLIVH